MKQKKPLRDQLQLLIYSIINPFVKLLIKIGFTPNTVTLIGLFLNIGVAIIFITGAEEGNRGDLSYVGWAGALILFAGLFDMLDGQVARLGNMSSSFGAMFDSVLDRYSELVMFLGICYYLVAHHYFFSSLFAFIALIGSMMVSYTRARAEGLGIALKSGLMQRPERVVLVGITALACGITSSFIGGDYKLFIDGIDFHVFETISIFTIPITLMAILTNITAYKRLMDAKKLMDENDRKNGILKMVIIVFVSSSLLLSSQNIQAQTAQPIQNSFPIPTSKNMLFYLQRNHNSNTLVYEINYDKKGVVDSTNPVLVYWIRYAEGGEQKDLSYIQRNYAYGIKSKIIGKYFTFSVLIKIKICVMISWNWVYL
ncbi:MAG: DUF4833 domain-containing protein, partial [Chitinophagaceae bacterium]